MQNGAVFGVKGISRSRIYGMQDFAALPYFYFHLHISRRSTQIAFRSSLMPMIRFISILLLVIASAALTIAFGYWVSGTGNSAPSAMIGAVLLATALAIRVWGRGR
ncbi:MAG: hypothetical protein WBA90_10080 [Albidovulum sp.]